MSTVSKIFTWYAMYTMTRQPRQEHITQTQVRRALGFETLSPLSTPS